MDCNQSTLLPYILDLLTREDNLCTTVDDLKKALRDAVLEEHIRPFGSLDLALKFALEVGSNLGILSLTDDYMPMPYNFRGEERQVMKKAPANSKASAKPKCKARTQLKSRAKPNCKARTKPKPKARAKPKSKARTSLGKCSGKKAASYKVGRKGAASRRT